MSDQNNGRNRYKQSAKKIEKSEKANRHINFVVVAYVVILFYLVSLIYLSFTKDTINYVFAEPGEIYNAGSFNGLVVKDEKIVYSSQEGPVKYFVPEGSKVRQNAYVCAVNQDPEVEAMIEDQINKHLSELNDVISMSVAEYEILQDKIRDYALDKHESSTNLVYNSKDILQGTILDISQTVYVNDQDLFNQIQEQIGVNNEQHEANGVYYNMPVGGVVGYTFDGFEELSIEELDFSVLDQEISVMDATAQLEVSQDDPLFKIIDNHKFHIVVEVDPYANKYLETKYDNGKRYNTLYFPRKNLSIDARIYDLEYDDGKYYAIFEIDRYFDRFFNDRFVEFIISYDDYSGIKIPNEAVTEMDLYQVPRSAVFEEKGDYKIQRKIYSDDDTTHEDVESVSVKVYYKDLEYAYVRSMDDTKLIRVGDEVLYTLDTEERISDVATYVVEEPSPVEGVFVLNRGYADFRRIVTVYEDDSFRIVSSGIGYSVGIYDKVASDASEITEFTTID